jgi:hypothetical protein
MPPAQDFSTKPSLAPSHAEAPANVGRADERFAAPRKTAATNVSNGSFATESDGCARLLMSALPPIATPIRAPKQSAAKCQQRRKVIALPTPERTPKLGFGRAFLLSS